MTKKTTPGSKADKTGAGGPKAGKAGAKRPLRRRPAARPRKKATGTAKPVLHAAWSNTIVPRENVAGSALTLVIAIMAFLACLTLGAVTMVSSTASSWQSEISREVTVQFRPVDGQDMESSLNTATGIAENIKGVAKVYVLDEEETARLLEPWLGAGLDLAELPVPRLMTVELEKGARPDLSALKEQIESQIPGSSFDDHRTWLERLTMMARATVFTGIGILTLVVTATVLTVVFATRGAMAGNRHVIEVLHFVGAEEGYIARQFQRHFLLLGLKGALAGGGAAMVAFLMVGFWAAQNIATPQGDQIAALFGSFTVGPLGYAGAFVLIFAIALLTAITSRLTVFRHVESLDQRSNGG